MSSESADLGTVLVVGAAGRHGGTGRVVLEELRAAGISARALARTDDDRAAALRVENVDVVVGDLRDRASMLRALDGCAAAYLTYPVGPGVVEATAAFASAARDRGVRRVVSMSMGPSHPLSPSPLGRAQWLAEEVLQWSGVPCTILRVFALFFENLVVLHGEEIRERSEFSNCFGDAAVPWIAGEDAARIAVAAFLRPERFPGAIAQLPGVERHSHGEVADLLTRVLGRQVAYRSVGAREWGDRLRAPTSQVGGVINDGMATHITTLGAGFAAGRAPAFAPNSSAIQDLIGREPLSLGIFLARHAQSFAARSC